MHTGGACNYNEAFSPVDLRQLKPALAVGVFLSRMKHKVLNAIYIKTIYKTTHAETK